MSTGRPVAVTQNREPPEPCSAGPGGETHGLVYTVEEVRPARSRACAER